MRNSTAQLQRAARERADDEARRIPWQRLLDTQNQYIDWQEFYLWVRSILEVEDRIPDWLIEILNARVPGFIETERALTPKAAKARPLHFRLEDWIDEHIFAFAKQEGSFFAITYYAIRDPRYQRAEVCWSECTEKWKKAKPIQYPSFEEWKALAAQCDETAHLVARERKARASVKLVDPVRLSEAVARYIDYEGLGVLGAFGTGARVRTSARGDIRTGATFTGIFTGCTWTASQEANRRGRRLGASDALDRRPLLSGREDRGLVRCHPCSGAEPSAGHSHHGVRRPL